MIGTAAEGPMGRNTLVNALHPCDMGWVGGWRRDAEESDGTKGDGAPGGRTSDKRRSNGASVLGGRTSNAFPW